MGDPLLDALTTRLQPPATPTAASRNRYGLQGLAFPPNVDPDAPLGRDVYGHPLQGGGFGEQSKEQGQQQTEEAQRKLGADPLLDALTQRLQPSDESPPLGGGDVPPPPSPSFGQQFAHGVGQFGSGTNQGIVGTLGFLPNMAVKGMNLAGRGLNALGIPTGPPIPPTTDVLNRGMAALGMERPPESKADEYTQAAGAGIGSTAASLLGLGAAAPGIFMHPFAAAPFTAPAGAALSGVASGVGGQAGGDVANLIDPGNKALQFGLSTAGNLAGGFGPGLLASGARAGARGIAAATQPLRDVNPIAGRMLKEYSPNPNPAQPAPIPGMRLTLGQQRNDPGYLSLERTMRDYGPANADFVAAEQQNQAALRAALEKLRSGQASDDASTAMSGALDRYLKRMQQREDLAWKPINDAQVKLDGRALAKTVEDYVANLPKAEQDMIPSGLREPAKAMSGYEPVTEFQALRSKARGLADEAARAGDGNRARVLNDLKNKIDAVTNRELDRAMLLDPKLRVLRPQLAQARKVSLELNQKFARKASDQTKIPVGGMMKKGVPTSIATDFLKAGKGQAERWTAFKKAVDNDPQAISDARDWFSNQLLDAALGTKGEVSPAAMERFLRRNRSLMASDIYTPAQKALIGDIAEGAAMAQRTANSGIKGGPDTAPKLLGAKYIDAMIGKWPKRLIAGGAGMAAAVATHKIPLVNELMGGGETLAGIAGYKGMEMLYELPAEEVKRLIRMALLDDKLAQSLRASVRPGKQMPDPLVKALRVIAATPGTVTAVQGLRDQVEASQQAIGQ